MYVQIANSLVASAVDVVRGVPSLSADAQLTPRLNLAGAGDARAALTAATTIIMRKLTENMVAG